MIQYARVGSVDEMNMNVSKEATSITISRLFSCTECSVKAAAMNANGIRHFSKSVVVILGEDSELNLFYMHICNTTGLGVFFTSSYVLYDSDSLY